MPNVFYHECNREKVVKQGANTCKKTMQNNIRSVGKGNAFGFTKWNRPQKLKYVRSVKKLSNRPEGPEGPEGHHEQPEKPEGSELFDLFPSTNATPFENGFSEIYQDGRTTVTIIHGNRERHQNGVSKEPKYFQIFESPDGKTIPLSMQPPHRITTSAAAALNNTNSSIVHHSPALNTAMKDTNTNSNSDTSPHNIAPTGNAAVSTSSNSEISDADLQFVNYQAQRYIVSIPHPSISQSPAPTQLRLADDNTHYAAAATVATRPDAQQKSDSKNPKKSTRLSKITPQQRVEFAKKRLAECSRLSMRPK